MIRTLAIAILFLLPIFSERLPGQDRVNFTPEASSLIQQYQIIFGNREPALTRPLLQKLEALLRSGKLEENQLIDLADHSNRLLEREALPYPGFYSYLNTFMTVSSGDLDPGNYHAWAAQTVRLLNDPSVQMSVLLRFFEFCQDLLSENILVRKSAFSWSVGKSQLNFGTDSSFYVQVSKTDLTGSGGRERSTIFETEGKFYPLSGLWDGKGGRIQWDRAGLPADQVFARLENYTINLERSVFRIDSVWLIDQRHFSEPQPGYLEERILTGIPAERVGYPRFTSYDQQIRVRNLYPDMDYRGGFTLQGNKVIGSGSPSRKSELLVSRKGIPFLRISSTHFSFEPQRARGLNAEATIYLGGDSVFHPGLLFQYNDMNKELALIRDGEGMSRSRYFNSFHKLDMDVQMVRWKAGDSLMILSSLAGSIENKAAFESTDYFSIERFNEIMMLDRQHPASMVKRCADYLHSRFYTVTDLADFMVKPLHLVEEMLLNLSFLGFVRFNSENGMVEVLQRTYDFVAKHAGNQDYDIIRFESITSPREPNALLNLNSGELTVFSVAEIMLSEPRNVRIFPKNNIVKIQRGRVIDFEGVVSGGLLQYYGEQFQFDYERFNIRMNKIDQIRIQVYEPAEQNQESLRLAQVTSIIENTSGTLAIDEITHKSGLEPEQIPEYPILTTTTHAYVYYDQPEILNGIYRRDTFYFKIDPFVLDSLNDVGLSEVLSFPGNLVTAGIFPPLRLSLNHQPDHSLGFDTVSTPSEGLPVYGGKGTFHGRLGMSRSGLRGSGTLIYLNATLESEDFLFLPDRVLTNVRTLAVRAEERDEGSPESVGLEVQVEWNPAAERMVANGENNPLSLYGEVEFQGRLVIEPSGLKGTGTLKMNEFEITSGEFTFFKESFLAANSSFNLGPDLQAENYNALINFESKKGLFDSPEGNGSIDFNKILYRSYAKSFEWDMETREIRHDQGRMVSLHPRQQSLEFEVGNGSYRPALEQHLSEGVKYITVADVHIYPDQGKVTLRSDAVMDTLKRALITDVRETPRHTITDASVSILSASSYRAKGIYAYRDVAEREYRLLLSDIGVRSGISNGEGRIDAGDRFFLSPAFQYNGYYQWDNSQPFLLFDGEVLLDYQCRDITREWIAFRSHINPDSVMIPVDSVAMSKDRNPLYKGFYLSSQPVELYSTFIGPHLRYNDHTLLSTYGWLWHDAASDRFNIAGNDKMLMPESDAPVLQLSRSGCVTFGEGKLDLGLDLGQITMQSAGIIEHNLNVDSLNLDLIMTLDFFMNDKAMEFLAKQVNNAPVASPVDYASTGFRKKFRIWLGQTRANELLDQLGLFGRWRKLPEEMNHTIMFTDLNLAWNPESGAYESTGDIGIGSIAGEPVNKMIPGHLELTRRRGGDQLILYLEPDRDNWFYISYSRGLMQVLAGPKAERFNEMVRNTKEAKRQAEAGPGQAVYQYYLGQYRQVRDFLERITAK